MNVRQVKKRFNQIFWDTISHTPLHKSLQFWYGGLGSIFMFHRIVNPSQRATLLQNRQLEVTSDYLRHLIESLHSRGYTFISMDEVSQALKDKPKKKFICLTLDDGYKDNLNVALPIFKEYKIPCAIYLTTGFMDRTSLVWWYALEALLLKTQTLHCELAGKKQTLALSTMDQKTGAFEKIKTHFLASSIQEIEKFFKDVAEPEGIFLHSYCEDLMLNWEEVKHLSSEPLVTLGAHTVTHRRLKGMQETEVLHEILESKKKIEAQTGKEVFHFAYPFGSPDDVSEREFRVVKELGFHTAVTTSYGNIFLQHRDYLERLPRLDIQEEGKTTRGTDLLLSGLPLARMRRLNPVVT